MQFIELLRNIEAHRRLSVITAFGTTEGFVPDRGLPQGETLAPILWNIFYDALLSRLQENPDILVCVPGTNERVSCPTFADDIHPNANTPQNLQEQLHIPVKS